jgi:hypothetical protein
MPHLSPTLRRLGLWLTACILAIPLVTHLYAGFFNRPLTDDFCLTVQARELGILGALDYWYNAWTGTYSSTFFQSIIGLGELWRFTPVILILLWMLALTWAIYQLLTTLGSVEQHGDRLPIAFGLTAVMLSVIVNSTLNVYQSLYWTSGAITYSAPLIVLTFNVGLFLRTVRRSVDRDLDLPALALTAGLAMLAGGFSPLFAVVHVAFWFFLLVGSVLFLPQRYRRTALITAFVGLIFAGIAFLILLIAPGNQVRRSRFTGTSPLWPLITFSFDELERFWNRTRYWLPSIAAFAVVGAWIRLVMPNVRRDGWWTVRMIGLIVFLTLCGVVLICCGYFTGAYAMNFAPPPRSEIVMRTAFLSASCAVGWLVGSLIAGWTPRRVMVPVLALLSLAAVFFVARDAVTMTNRTLSEARRLAIYAEDWDTLDRWIDASAGDPTADILVQRFAIDFADMADLDPISTDPERNACIRDYYRVGSVRMAR